MKKARKLPNGWIEFRIKDKFQTGSGATPLSTKKEFYENGNIPWINSGELESPYINSTSNFITQLGFESGMRTKSWTPKRGDLWHIQSNKLLQH